MTTLRYQRYHLDAYQQTIDTTVAAVDGNRVALEDTVFFPQGGGQPADHGTLTWPGGAAEVVEVAERDGQVWHELAGPLPPAGTGVHGSLDWARRYALMRMHTATHVLNGVIWRDLRAHVTGVQLQPDVARMDFELERLTDEVAAAIQAATNQALAADLPVRVRLLPRAEALAIPDLVRLKSHALPEGVELIRAIEIVGLDLQADGGTHVRSTGEVGRIRIVGRDNKGRSNKRLRIALEP